MVVVCTDEFDDVVVEGAMCGVMIGLSVEVVVWWRGSGMVRAAGDSVVGVEGWEGRVGRLLGG